MRKGLILLGGLLIWSIGVQVYAQESTKHPETKTAVNVNERPKTEVEKQLDELKEHGERVLAACLEDCDGKGLTGDLETGHALELPKPDYPAIARAAHASGQVIVQVIVDEEGKVVAASAVSGHPLLYGVAVKAARQARFSPTKFNGEPVKVTGVISYNFVAQ